MAEIPSSTSARSLVRGEPGGVIAALLSTVARAGIIGAGLYVAGARGRKLVVYAAAGAVAIEAFVLAWVVADERSRRPAGDGA